MYEIFEKLLKKYNVTPYRVAKITRIANSTLSDWKNNVSVPKTDKLQKIADYFNVSLEYLLGQTDKQIARKKIFELLKKETDYSNFSKKTGIDIHKIATWEREVSDSYMDYLPQIADYFNVSVDYLLGKTNTPKLPDELKNVNVAFFDGAFDGLDEKDIDLLKQMAKRLKEQKNK